MYKDSGPTLAWTRLQQVEHEAVCLLTAGGAGVSVDEIVAAGVAGPSAALLATSGDHEADPYDPDSREMDHAVVALWHNVARLRYGACGARGPRRRPHPLGCLERAPDRLRPRLHLLLPDALLDRDAAQALVFSAVCTDPDCGAPLVLAAYRGSRDFARLGATSTKPALTLAGRRVVRADKGLLDQLATAVATATDGELYDRSNSGESSRSASSCSLRSSLPSG